MSGRGAEAIAERELDALVATLVVAGAWDARPKGNAGWELFRVARPDERYHVLPRCKGGFLWIDVGRQTKGVGQVSFFGHVAACSV